MTTETSIVDPAAYLAPGYPDAIMAFTDTGGTISVTAFDA